MTAYYGCSANIPLPEISEAIESIIEELRTLLEGADEARIEKESDSDGVVWLRVQCPERNYPHGFIADLESGWNRIAPGALEGFAVEYVYENRQGADFFGPTPEAAALARRRCNFAKAAHFLEQEGIDLRRLLEIERLASAISETIRSVSTDFHCKAVAAESLERLGAIAP